MHQKQSQPVLHIFAHKQAPFGSDWASRMPADFSIYFLVENIKRFQNETLREITCKQLSSDV
jgi:hypothetical protein